MKLCDFDIGLDQRIFLIAGPCVIESEQLQMDVAGQLKEITASLGIPFIFKSSFDKANRSSGTTYRGPGREKGLEILAKVKRELGVPVLTDVHSEEDIADAAKVCEALTSVCFDRQLRTRLGANARTVVDGGGAVRIAGAIDSLWQRHSAQRRSAVHD